MPHGYRFEKLMPEGVALHDCHFAGAVLVPRYSNELNFATARMLEIVEG
jgi:hypothetical protein